MEIAPQYYFCQTHLSYVNQNHLVDLLCDKYMVDPNRGRLSFVLFPFCGYDLVYGIVIFKQKTSL